MKRLLFLIYFAANICYAQTFQLEGEYKISGAINSSFVADLNSDGKKEFHIVNNDSLYSILLENNVLSARQLLIGDVYGLYPYDFSKNNFLDAIFSDELTISLFKNDFGRIDSQQHLIASKALKSIEVKDIDLNGITEFIGFEEQKLAILSEDSIALLTEENIQAFKLFDYNGDGSTDLMLTDQNGLSRMLIHVDRLQFSDSDTLGYVTEIAAFDFDSTGINDLLVFNKEKQLTLYLNPYQDSTKIILDSLKYTTIDKIQMSDLNSDGGVDIMIAGSKNINHVTSLLLSNSTGNYNLEILKSDESSSYSFHLADKEADGDLDAILFSTGSEDTTQIFFYKNISSKVNQSPTLAPNATAFPTLNGVYLFFDSAYDDTTPSSSLTYDLLCYEAEKNIWVPSDFNMASHSRYINRTGNIGMNKKVYLPDLEPGFYNYKIQSIDNALHAGSDGICEGTFEWCANFTMTELTVCEGETILLEGDKATNGRWFSANKRNLTGGSDPILEYTAYVDDTIYYASTATVMCEDYSIWKINVVKPSHELPSDTLLCLQETLEIDLAAFDSVAWKSTASNDSSSGDFFYYEVKYPTDTILFSMYQENCLNTDTLIINASIPDVTLNKEIVTINRGEAVDLFASGAESYHWYPSTGLKNTSGPINMVTPEISTAYTVVGYDTLGCMDSTSIYIEVRQTSFLPNLFTPNNDRQNDNLRIIGLDDVSSFQFIIYDRYGKKIYESYNPHEAVTKGWDGNFSGAQQPDGIYFWKISGTYSNGNTVLLNGKSKGEVILKR